MCYWNRNFFYSSILIIYDDDDYSQGYDQSKQFFKALSKDYILQPYESDQDFRSLIVTVDDVGCILYDFDIRYQKNFTNSQPNKVELKLDGVSPNDINGYALVLTNKLV